MVVASCMSWSIFLKIQLIKGTLLGIGTNIFQFVYIKNCCSYYLEISDHQYYHQRYLTEKCIIWLWALIESCSIAALCCWAKQIENPQLYHYSTSSPVCLLYYNAREKIGQKSSLCYREELCVPVLCLLSTKEISLLPNFRLVLDEKFQQNASKCENPKVAFSVFHVMLL